MKTLIFNGSPRKNGGTSTLIKEFQKSLNGDVIVVDAYYAGVSPCVDCRFCWENDSCIIDDEMQNIYQHIIEADNILIASPIYFAELTGPLLSLFSRLQYFWIAKNFGDNDICGGKNRNGYVILVDAGQGRMEASLAMAKRLLRTMGSKFIDYVYFSGTENEVKDTTHIPDEVISGVQRLANLANFS